MADFSALKQSIQNYIKQNGNKEITGTILQNILLSMVTTMGDGAINDNASDISDIKGDIQNINGDITNINSSITDINGDITDINGDITDINGDLSDEVNRAKGAEGTLQQNITAEENRAKGAETTMILFSDGKLVFKNAAGTVLYQLSVDSFLSAITTRLNTGALYAGYATPSTTPAALTSQEVFYLATQAGTYTNFHFNGGDDPIVLTKDGIYFIVSGTDDDDWNAEPMLQLDDVPTAGSDNPVKSGGVYDAITSKTPLVKEDGFHVVDENLNVGMKYDENGLDVAKVSPHFIQILKDKGIGSDNVMSNYSAKVDEDGFFIVDEDLNIGVKVDNNGISAKNIPDCEIIEN